MSEIQFTRKVVDDEADGGRSGLVHFLLTGERGTVELLLMKPTEQGTSRLWPESGGWYSGGIAYHAPFPYQPDQELRQDPCEYVPGGRCYYSVQYWDRSTELLQRWWDAGSDDEVIWQAAEDFYLAFFMAREPAEHLRKVDEILAEALGVPRDGQEAGQ